MVLASSLSDDVVRLCVVYGFVIPLYPAARTEDGNSMTGSVLAGRMKLSTEYVRELANERGLVGDKVGLGDTGDAGDAGDAGDMGEAGNSWRDLMLGSREGGMILTSAVGDITWTDSDTMEKSTPGAREIKSTLLSSSPSSLASKISSVPTMDQPSGSAPLPPSTVGCLELWA